jgi:hypothetical protein
MYRLPPELRAAGATHDAIIGHRILSGLMAGEKSDTAVKQKLADLGTLSSTKVASDRQTHRRPLDLRYAWTDGGRRLGCDA